MKNLCGCLRIIDGTMSSMRRYRIGGSRRTVRVFPRCSHDVAYDLATPSYCVIVNIFEGSQASISSVTTFCKPV